MFFGIEQRQQLMHITVGIPQGENRVAGVTGLAGTLTLHYRVLTVHIVQHVGMNQCVIQSGIEDRLLIVVAPLGHHCR